MQLPDSCFSIFLGTLSHNGRCVLKQKLGSLRLPFSPIKPCTEGATLNR